MPHTKIEKANKPVESLGDFMQFGYYSIFFIVMYELLILPQMSNMTFMIYAGSAPTVVSCGNHSLRHFTSNVEACAEMRSLQADTGCEPGIETQFGSLAYEFGYICEKIVDVKKSISAQMFGVLCGRQLPMCSDIVLSRSLILRTVVRLVRQEEDHASMPCGNACARLCRFLLWLAHAVHVDPVLRDVLRWWPQYIFAGVSYLAGDWRTLIRIAGLMNIPAFFVLLCAFESPRWLIQKMKLETARSVLIKIERFNGTATEERLKIVDELIEKEMMACESKKRGKKYYLFHLFYTSKMCCYSAIISLCTSIISYALIFNMEHLSGSIFLNSALFGLFRYSMNLLVGSLDYFIPRAGRKPVHHAALSFILVMLSIVFVSKLLDLNDATILRVTTLSAAAMCSQLYMVNAVVTSELFPTAVRNLAASFVQISSRTGAVLSPHLFYLASLWEPLPFLLMLVLMAMNMLLFGIFIPETKGSPMVDHMPDPSERLFARKPTELHLLSKGADVEEKEDC
ncbi:OAT-1 protein [Aphelenchoides avenae]|nr:OAT-1 protein [Aphelenchus avenae]